MSDNTQQWQNQLRQPAYSQQNVGHQQQQDRQIEHRGGQNPQGNGRSLSLRNRRVLRDAMEDLFSDDFLTGHRMMREMLNEDFTGFVPFQHLTTFPHLRSLLQDMDLPQDMWSSALADVSRDLSNLRISGDNESVSRLAPLQNANVPQNDSCTVYLQNIPQNATLSEIQQKLKPFGNVVSIQRQVASHQESNQQPQQVEAAIVVFDKEESAKRLRENPPTFESGNGPLRIIPKEQYLSIKQQMSWPQLSSNVGGSLPAIGSRPDQQQQGQQQQQQQRQQIGQGKHAAENVQQGSAAGRQQVGAADQQAQSGADRRW